MIIFTYLNKKNSDMFKHLPTLLLLVAGPFSACHKTGDMTHIRTTETQAWTEVQHGYELPDSLPVSVLVIDTTVTGQSIEGFGACFNELGWLALSRFDSAERESILKELFEPGTGAGFTICRIPIGANDFSSDWYSYDETEGDFELKDFSIARDRETLLPFIRAAKRYNPHLRIWASPWSPPTWMKRNRHYAMALCGDWVAPRYHNGLKPHQAGREGADMFIQDPEYLQAYARYFGRFIEAYRNEGIDIFAVMPQNEFNSAQIFPSCCWTAASLGNFVADYLGPEMERAGVEIYFGTMERPNAAMIDTVMQTPGCAPYIKGIGFQWAGKGAIGETGKRYPGLKLYQTEQECGDGKNDWKGTMHSWDLLKHYFDNGTTAYMYWNIALDEGGVSRWGWAQNSLVVVDPATGKYRYTPEYYLMKHISRFVRPGARYLPVGREATEALAFRNADGSVIVLLVEKEGEEKSVRIRIGEREVPLHLASNSINTIRIG